MENFNPADHAHAHAIGELVCRALLPIMPAGARFLCIVYTDKGQVIAGEADPAEMLDELTHAITKAAFALRKTSEPT